MIGGIVTPAETKTYLEWVEAIKPTMQAHVDGKTIEYYDIGYRSWKECHRHPAWSMYDTYRVKPEPKTRPYTDAELKEQVGKAFTHKPTGQVFIASSWTGVSLCLSEYGKVNRDALASFFTHIDGAPCEVTE
jgi:hypothetical protein